MEPLPLIPRIQYTVTPEIGCLVREVFQNAFQTDTAAWRISKNLLKSCRQNPYLIQIATEIQTDIFEHKGILDDLEYAEIQIIKSHGYHLCRDQIFTSNERAREIIRLKRHPLYIDLHPNIIEKYSLLQSDDLLPPMHECATDFRLAEKDRIRMKKRLYKSRDSLLDEIPLPKVTSRICRFDTLTEQRSKKMRSAERSAMVRTATHKRSIIRSENPKTVLIAEPEELLFHNFEYNKMYKKIVLIKNVSDSMARYKIERRSPDSKFTVFFDTAAVETTKIAPGMHVKLTVLFLCDVVEDPQEFLIINVQSGKTVCVKMHGYRDPPILRAVSALYQICSESVEVDMDNNIWSLSSIIEEEGEPDIYEEQRTKTLGNVEEYGKGEVNVRCNVNLGANFECGKCFVGERIVVPTRFLNDGGYGKFFIMSEIDWCAMDIAASLLPDIMDCNMILLPPFAIWPIYFALSSGECVEIRTYFYPESYGTQVDKLYILCDNHTIHPIELIGDGVLYEPDIVRFGDNIEKTRSPVNETEPFATYYLNMGDVGPDQSVEKTVLVTNTSGLVIYYRWERHAEKDSTLSPMNSWTDLPIENLDIQQATGFFKSNSITSFKVIAQTKDLQLRKYRAILRLYIEDIPLAAIPKDCNSKITECCVKRRNCPITVDIVVADVEVWVHYTPGKTSLNTDISEETESETGYSSGLDNQAEKRIDRVSDNYLLSSPSMTIIQSPSKESCLATDDPSICGMRNVQCNKFHQDVKNSGTLWSASLDMVENVDNNTSTLAIPRLDFHYQSANTAILIPGRPLYVGIEQVYTLRLRNLICKPLSYAWGQPIGKDCSRMKVDFNPVKGFIPPTDTATIEIICLPIDTDAIDHFFVPCFIGGREDPIMLGIECTISTVYVTFIFLPAPNDVSSPCIDSVRIEWHKDGNTSALNLNNFEMNQNFKIEEEQELKNINLDAGSVFATAGVGPTSEEAENVSIDHLPETLTTAKQKLHKLEKNKAQNKSTERSKLKDKTQSESLEKIESPKSVRSWESLLKGIIWTDDRPDEIISLTKSQATVPFHKTIVPPIMQALAIEFVDLPLRTVKKRTFVIRNETPAQSKFLITLKQFGLMETVKELNPKNMIDLTYANVMGHESDNYWEKIKPPGQGIVLVMEPMGGVLAPHETVPIDIYVYADTWGIYVDEITVAIPGLPDYVFGVCAQVVGSPIAYPICRNGLHETPILRFGTLSLGTESVTRKIMIENTSGVILIVNWYSYLINSHPETESSIPFNVTLQMFSPFTNRIANMTYSNLGSTRNIEQLSTADTTTERSQQIIMDSDQCDSETDSTIIEINSTLSNCCETENQSFEIPASDLTWHTCCSESLISTTNRIPDQARDCTTENSVRKDYLDNEYVEYTTESEIRSVGPSEQSIDKETDLELTLTPYYGIPDYSMFTVSPAEIILPVKGKKVIQITLNIGKNNLRMENCKNEILGRLMGFIRVAPIHKYKADCYSRNDGTMLTPTEIQLEATIIQPILSHEISMSETSFKIFATGVITQFGKQIEICRKYVFRNDEGETMFVNGQSSEPFQVLSLSTQNAKINPSESDGISVLPGQSVEVEVLCSVDGSWIDRAIEMARYRNTGDLYLDTKKSLRISHCGSCNQEVSLCLRVYLPLLKLSTHKMNFGTVCLGNSKRMDLSIENISSEKQILNIRAKKNNKDFAISQNRGVLSLADRTLDFIVTFTPSGLNRSVEALEISTAVPGYIEECIIEGYGSWDEKSHRTDE